MQLRNCSIAIVLKGYKSLSFFILPNIFGIANENRVRKFLGSILLLYYTNYLVGNVVCHRTRLALSTKSYILNDFLYCLK